MNRLFLLFVGWCAACGYKPVAKDHNGSKSMIAKGEYLNAGLPYSSAIVALVDPSGDSTPFCSGALINRRVVITAAHCITNEFVHVIFGLGLGRNPMISQGRGIKHPQYGAAYNEPLTFDLGLIVLFEEAPSSAKSLGLAKKGDFNPGDRATIAGYGSMARAVTDPHPRENQGTPQQADVKIYDIFHRGDEDVRDDMSMWGLIAASALDPQAGGCEGDSGGPLMVWKGAVPLLAGIINGSVQGGICHRDLRATNLPFYEEWMREVLANERF